MNRRYFSLSIATPLIVRAAPRSPIRITKIALCPIEGRFHKFIAMNSQAARPNGHTYTNTLVRIGTDQGLEGIGVMDYSPRCSFSSSGKVAHRSKSARSL